MIDHININVSDFDGARAFYTQALAPLGVEVIMEFPGTAGLGNAGKPDLWISERDEPSAPIHVAISAPDRDTVDAFHAAAIEAGGTDNGAPGPRPQYHENYYGAFVLDPDGNNVEAVCHLKPE
ncbi:MAG TPA: VOC family protein [Solirubrobacterales bacterium]|nr:VOC family protein [Solirubrobacterales bacterium]